MKQSVLVLAFSSMIVGLHASEQRAKPLGMPPAHNERILEIVTQYNNHLPPLWNSLTPEERVFAYYMVRASIPGNRILTDQKHRNGVEILELFDHIITHEAEILELSKE